jgi:glycerol-3-phosphate acyltransferase PlsY
MTPALATASVAVVGYLLGSIPSGLLFGHWLRGVDIRAYGSGRTGATNAMRSLGARGFALTFAADAGKAVVAVLLARVIAGAVVDVTLAGSVAAVAAIVGHNWPLYIGFRGGRGVSCSFGSILMLYWPGALLGLVVFGVLLKLTRYVSLGSIVGTLAGLAAALVAVATGAEPPVLAGFAVAAAAIVIGSHKDNIERLLAGTERKIGQRAGPA